MTSFATLLGSLHDAGVEFILVGGVAAVAHGSARLTQDIDVSYARSETNLRRIVTALLPHEPYLRGAPSGLPFEWSVETLRSGLNFTLTTRVSGESASRVQRRHAMPAPRRRGRRFRNDALGACLLRLA